MGLACSAAESRGCQVRPKDDEASRVRHCKKALVPRWRTRKALGTSLTAGALDFLGRSRFMCLPRMTPLRPPGSSARPDL